MTVSVTVSRGPDIDQAILPASNDKLKVKYYKIGGLCCTLLIVIIILIILRVVDKRMADPAIEAPLIKEFQNIPKGMTKGEMDSLSWFPGKWVPFPIKELVNNGTIKIDKAFAVNKMVVTPDEFPCPPSSYEPGTLACYSTTVDGKVVGATTKNPKYLADTDQTKFTWNYIG